MLPTTPDPVGLYDPAFEHDACGVSFVVDMKGRRSHAIVATAIGALCNLEHRGATGDEANTGDGAGILIQIPDRFYREAFRADLPPEGAYATGIAFLPAEAGAAQAAQNALAAGSVPVNPGAAMPITVQGVRFRMICLPTSDASPANVPRHNSSLITTTAFCPGAAQSVSTKPRPCTGCSFSTSK